MLLEIETDKAQMDVEAQDDGILAKITQADGSKAVKVGSRIAVLADPGDDVSSLEIPAEEKQASSGQPVRKDRPSPQEEMSSGIDKTESSESAAEAPPSSKPNADASAGGAADTAGAVSAQSSKSESKSPSSSSAKARKQTYPLYPSVQYLLHLNGLDASEADKIPASGPNGRLLKGDVLSYLGTIERNYSAEQSARIEKMGHLDLSNIKISTPKKEAAAPAKEAKAAPSTPKSTEIALPISLAAVIATQKRVQDTLGIFLPLSTFIARASELANEDLPRSKSRQPTSTELFNAVLGLDKVSRPTSKGAYMPFITGLNTPPTSLLTAAAGASSRAQRPVKKDIFDLLTAPKGGAKSSRTAAGLGVSSGVSIAEKNVFSVVALSGDERRVRTYLERMKQVLEAEPGRLVL